MCVCVSDELQCEPVECASDCDVTRDQYGCPQCDCNSTDALPALRSAPVVCERQFCPVGCPSHYEDGCIVCECETKTKNLLKRMTTIRSTTSALPITTTTQRPCPLVTCRPHCGYKRNPEGCTVCDCPTTATLWTTTALRPCVTVTCRPHCGYKKDADGCAVCDCPPVTTRMAPTFELRPSLCPGFCFEVGTNFFGCSVCSCSSGEKVYCLGDRRHQYQPIRI